jgi:methylisocitrate lyase
MALYPLSAFRAMNKAAENVFQTIRNEGTQKSVINSMQTREELYKSINYHEYESALDKFQSEQRGE